MKPSPLIRKTALVALLLAAALFLSGCNLVVKDPAVDARQVILTVNGEEVHKADFTRYLDNAYQRALEEQQMMQQYGYPAQPINEAMLLQTTLDNTAKDRLLHQKAHELGLDALTQEEEAALDEQAEADYADILEQVKFYYFMGSELEGEALDAAAAQKAEELGLTLDIFKESARETNLHEKLHEYAGRDVVITEEDIQAAFEARVEEERARYAENPAAFGEDLSNEAPIYYSPAGYRWVRQILVPLSDEDQGAIRQLESEERSLQSALDSAKAALTRYEELAVSQALSPDDKVFLDEQAASLGEQAPRLKELLALEGLSGEERAELDTLKARLPVSLAVEEAGSALTAKQEELAAKKEAAFAAIQPQTDEVMAKAQAPDADFDALVEEHSQDPGQPQTGYAVSEATTAFVPAFTQGAMALEKPGDISQPIPTAYGNHILRYAADIQEGPATLDSVRETLREELFETRRGETYQELEAAWLAQADIKLYPERMKD